MTRTLLHGGAAGFDSPGEGWELWVCQGHAWITVTGSTHDHVLRAGQRLPLPDRGRVVVSTLDGNPLRVKLMKRGPVITVGVVSSFSPTGEKVARSAG